MISAEAALLQIEEPHNHPNSIKPIKVYGTANGGSASDASLQSFGSLHKNHSFLDLEFQVCCRINAHFLIFE